MTHSEIVSELLHKLSKNELLLQDGGKSQYYRSQLNSMMGRGNHQDTDSIIKEIEELIPMSLLRKFADEAKKKMTALKAKETALEQQVLDLGKQIEALKITNTDNAAITSLLDKSNNELSEVRKKIDALEAELKAKETELRVAADELNKLTIANTGLTAANTGLNEDISNIKTKVYNVKNNVTHEQIMADLLAQLN